jgi:hypothetical protein
MEGVKAYLRVIGVVHLISREPFVTQIWSAVQIYRGDDLHICFARRKVSYERARQLAQFDTHSDAIFVHTTALGS